MKIRHELAIDATGRRQTAQQGETPNEIRVTLKLTIEAARGEPVLGALEKIGRSTSETVVKTLDRRPY